MRDSFGNMLALLVGRLTPGGERLDPRIDAVVGLLPRWRNQDEIVYGRIPPDRLARIVGRILSERPSREDSAVALDYIQLIQRAPEATPAFLDYLRARKQLRRIAAGGDLAGRFDEACAASPRIAELAAGARPKAKASRGGQVGAFVIVKRATVRSPGDVEALGKVGVAQFLVAAAAVSGRKKVASLAAAFERPLRDGEARLVAEVHAVREVSPGGGVADGDARYDLWTFFGDTGLLFAAGTTKAQGVEWIQGHFEAEKSTHAALVRGLEAATWR